MALSEKITACFLIIIIFVFSGCNNKIKFDGYSMTESGIYYKLVQFGENRNKPVPGDYLYLHIVYLTGDDSVFFDAYRNIKLDSSKYKGSVQECLMMLSEMDSACFCINADNFFNKTLNLPLPSFIPKNSYMKINIKVLSMRTETQYQKEKKEFLSWITDFGEYEQTLLQHYIEKEQININPASSGIYRINIRKGDGIQIMSGDTITMHYEGRLLNGRVFDSTKERNEPFQFVYGTEWQVLKGIEESLKEMSCGEHSLLIMPSRTAFGESGSSSGYIPPYTTVIFEVEVLDVKKSFNNNITHN